MKEKLLHNWHLMRVLRLAFGIIFIVQAFFMKDIIVGFAAFFFLFQAVTNTGCCGESCATTYDNNHKKSANADITFEEIK